MEANQLYEKGKDLLYMPGRNFQRVLLKTAFSKQSCRITQKLFNRFC